MEVLKNPSKFNFLTHLLFPSRSFIKELIYWPTEIVAAIIVFAYIIEIKTDTIRLYNGYDKQVDGWMYQKTDPNTFGFNANNNPALLGIAYLNPNAAWQIGDYKTDLLNREYAWIALCYMIKHAFYLADFGILFKRKLCKLHDFITPIMNLWLWTMWGIFGWLKSDVQIHGGMYLRFRKDVIFNSDLSSPNQYNSAKMEYDNAVNVYKDVGSWNWLWVICAIVFFFNLILWLISIKQKRSSAFTGLSLSVVLIPLQLFILNLFFKGSWIRSNWPTIFIDTTSPLKTMYSLGEDYFEARWVFVVIYLSSWFGGLIFSLACLVHGIYVKKAGNTLGAIKYWCYFPFWVSAFIWALFMDGTLYHYYVNFYTGLIVTEAICLFFALAIFALSVLEKKKEGDKFYKRHENWGKWWWSNNAEGDNMAERSAFEEKAAGVKKGDKDEKVPINPESAHKDNEDTVKAQKKEISADKAQSKDGLTDKSQNKEIFSEHATPYVK